jgi:hypothetical protein
LIQINVRVFGFRQCLGREAGGFTPVALLSWTPPQTWRRLNDAAFFLGRILIGFGAAFDAALIDE